MVLKGEDTAIIEGIRRGDRRILTDLYRDMLPSIKRLAAVSGLGADDARDVFQDAVVVVFEKAGQSGFALTSSFSTFFTAFAATCWVIASKKSARNVTITDDMKYRVDDNNTDAQGLLEVAERHRLFHRAFRQLGDDCRRLLELSFENERPETIMATLGIASNDYFRRRKYLCKEKLIQLVKNDPGFRELDGFE